MKKVLGTVVISADRCKGCAFCVAFCPRDALKLSETYNAKGYRVPELVSEDACTGCGLCGLYCPDFAIHGYIIKNVA
jgi:2-oxoglutarate ferredoxin oxidoreductase subunit delta